MTFLDSVEVLVVFGLSEGAGASLSLGPAVFAAGASFGSVTDFLGAIARIAIRARVSEGQNYGASP